MKKIKITEEQENAYKLLLINSNYDGYRVLRDFSTIRDKQSVYSQYKPLLSLTIEELSLILNRWYEVEQSFKVGDWVYNKMTKGYRKIVSKSIKEFMDHNEVPKDYVLENMEGYEKIEPWKITLLELGRDKPEFNPNDIIVTNSEVYKAGWLKDKEIIELYNKDLIEEIHIYENRIEVKR